MKKQLFVWVCGILMAACSTTQEDSAIVIDLTAPTDTVCYLSEIADSIVYYPLAVPYLVEAEVLGKYIYAYSQMDNSLRMFDRNNKQLVKNISFGALIGGPGYQPYFAIPANTHFPFEKEEWFICPRREEKGNKVFYSSAILNTLTEEWGESIAFPDYGYAQINDYVIKYRPGTIMITKRDTIQWFNRDMKLIKEDVLDELVLDYPYVGLYEKFNVLKDKVYYHAPTSHVIYEVSPEQDPIPLYRFELGNHRSRFKEFADYELTTKMGYKNEKYNSSPYYLLRSSKISEHYIWGAYNYKGKTIAVLFDKANERTYTLPTKNRFDRVDYPIVEGGLTNDLDGGLDFWPKRISKNGEIFTWYTVEELKAKVAQSHSGQMKNPDTARRLKEMLDNLPEDVNVIVAVLKEKKVKN